MRARQAFIGFFIAFTQILSGCATAPRLDLGTPARAQAKGTKLQIASIEVINKAPKGSAVNPVFGDTLLPMFINPSTQSTVEDDLRSYFEGHTTVDSNYPVSLSITITKAEAYLVMTMVDKTPFVGLARLGADKGYFIDVKFQIDVEKNGKVQSSYSVDQHVAIETNYDDAYRNLIDRYREVIFKELDDRFTYRYL